MKWNTTLYDQSHAFVSKYGEGILLHLNAQAGERILDLGCGTGDLTKEIALTGAHVVGIDASAEMIEKARFKYPELEFRRMDAKDIAFDEPFDAIFSNAVLHWIPEKEMVIRKMYENLKVNGRIALEFGGKGNNQWMLQALRQVFEKHGYDRHAAINFWYYPSIGEYSCELERIGFRVTYASHFDRITPLKGERGIVDWFLMFGDNFFTGIPVDEKKAMLEEVQEMLLPTHYNNGVWHADYKRVRFVAVKESPD